MERALVYGIYSNRNRAALRYIGQTKFTAKRRLALHARHANKGGRSPLCKWIRREVSEGFSIEILPLCIGERNSTEIFYIQRCKDLGYKLLNVSSGGDGGDTRTGAKHTLETRAKMSLSSIGKNKGIVRDADFRARVSATMKERCKDPEVKKKLRMAGSVSWLNRKPKES